MSATGELVSFICDLDPVCLPDFVLKQASRCVLDLVGVAISGTRTPTAKISARFAFEQFAPGNITVIGSRQSLCTSGATWVNGALASTLDMDDGNRMAMGHPGSNVIPAALAVAQQTGASGREFLAAIVAGYEVAVRASVARVPSYKDQMYSTGIWGVFGATTAAAKLLKFDEATLQSALGIAGSHGPFPPGGLQANHAMTKEVIAWSGMTGVAAALLAQRGFIGPPDIMDYSGRWDTAVLLDGLGSLGRSAILNTYFKPYAVCRWAHAPVDAALELKKRYNLRHREIEKIRVESFWEVAQLCDYTPSNTVAAQFSIPFALALALTYDKIGPEEVSEANLHNQAILDLAQKVELTVDPVLNSQFPAKTMAQVTIHTRRGNYRMIIEHPRGNPENPLSDTELADKFSSLSVGIIGENTCAKLLAAISGLVPAKNVSSLTELLVF
jgi:2-methylcitrate dehydratase PrpD